MQPRVPGTTLVYFNFSGYPDRQTMGRTAEALVAALSSGDIRTVLVDMRRNSGGNLINAGSGVTVTYAGGTSYEIGNLLGHRNPQTTKIYAKVDIKALRTLALHWPGDAP